MLSREELKQRLEPLVPTVDASVVERALQELRRQGEDVGGGINAFRPAEHLLRDLLQTPSSTQDEVT